MDFYLLTEFVVLFFCGGKVASETVLLLGGEVDNLLHPAITSVEAVGACGPFDAGVPDLLKPRRDFAGALYGNELVVCGGYQFLGAQKDCSALTLGTWPLEWREFPSLLHARDYHGMVVVGDSLFVVGGRQFIGSEHSIERFNGDEWEDFGETYGFRTDFCTLPWGEDGILLIGGYDDIGNQKGVDLFNITTKAWRKLGYLNIGRGEHGCAEYLGGVVVAGGWTANNDPNWPGQVVTKTSEWYDPGTNSWTELGTLRAGRTKFALETVNGTLFALGGWEGNYVQSIETLSPDDGGWDYFDQNLDERKAAFAVVKVPEDLLEDTSCDN